jgi:hypothetical protein
MRRFALIALCLAALPAESAEKPTVRAVATTEAPSIDGVLDEAAWQAAEVIDSFVQQEPREGQAATDRTEVRVLYDEGHLYFGVRAYSSEPVVATEMRRDADRLFDEDNFQVILGIHDSRNGYMFLTSPWARSSSSRSSTRARAADAPPRT